VHEKTLAAKLNQQIVKGQFSIKTRGNMAYHYIWENLNS